MATERHRKSRAVAAFAGSSGLTIMQEDWSGFCMAGLCPSVRADGADVALAPREEAADAAAWRGNGLSVRAEILPCGENGVELRTALAAEVVAVLNRADVLSGESVRLGEDPDQVRVMILSRYGGDVVPLCGPESPRAGTAGEPNEPAGATESNRLTSENVMVVYDRASRRALLIGFLASERWQGQISLDVTPRGEVRRLTAGFDGGDLRLEQGREVPLEPLVILGGGDPWALLEQYGDLVAERHGVVCPEATPVSWCSWYPFRLGVTEDRLLAEARVAAERLKPLGLSIIEADLGWERLQLPSAFEPNERFPHGLRWLSDELGKLGFRLGVWKAPFTISEFDDLPTTHPEWLICGDDGRPVSVWTWFWEPHGDVYVLDLTHPGAQQWLRERFAVLHAAGVGYFKADFIGMASDARAKRRHDARVVAGAGTEAARTGARIIREELPDALILNCGGPPMPGAGAWPLLYICNDTGNTGLQSWEFMRENFRAVACHLWQNRRWAVIQASCLCVGLPGTLEEARLRATAAFLSGGQIDVSDTLTTLPEDRWAVIEATLPPLGLAAQPVDLFEPVHHGSAADYEALCRGLPTASDAREHPPGSVWRLRIERGWDAWDLVACFAFDQPPGTDRPELTNFTVPLDRLGLEPAGAYWAYEFWGGQFLGAVPGGRTNPDGYAHPGDWQDLSTVGPAGALSFSFTGPGVKLLALRPQRPHPWVVGTSFHQSCGAELRDVAWNPDEDTLSGRLDRPAGQTGHVIVAAGPRTALSAEVDGHPAPLTVASGGSYRLSVTTAGRPTSWRVLFARPTGL